MTTEAKLEIAIKTLESISNASQIMPSIKGPLKLKVAQDTAKIALNKIGVPIRVS